MIGTMELGRAPRTQRYAPAGNEAELTFMLARPALTRWQFETERLRQLAGNWSAAKRRLALLESELGLAQVKALSERIEPLTKSQDIAVRFEAQETLVALDSVGGQLGSIRERVRESGRPAAPAEAATPELSVEVAAKESELQAMPLPSAAGGEAPPPQAARFEARYLEHLVGRPAGPATQAAPVPARGDGGAASDSGFDPDFEKAAREIAYFLWEQDGRPEGHAEQYWERAVDTLHRQRDGEGDVPRPPHNGATRPVWLDGGAPDAFAELAAALGSLCDPPDPPEVATARASGDSTFQDTAS